MTYYRFKCENCNCCGRFYYRFMQRGDYCSSFGCKKCKKVVEYCNEELSELMKGTKCKECNGDLIDYPKEMRSFDIGKDRLICPKCGERKLKIVRDKGYEV